MLIAGINFFAVGPLVVGTAVLARSFSGEATAFGFMLSALAGGALAGTMLAGSVRHDPKLGPKLRMVATVGYGFVGLGTGLRGMLPGVAWVSADLALMGIGAGFINVVAMTWLQRRSDPQMRGRVMSLMFNAMGLTPFSYAIAGVVADLSPRRASCSRRPGR